MTKRAIAAEVACMLCEDPGHMGVAFAAGGGDQSAWLFRVCDGCLDDIVQARDEHRKLAAFEAKVEKASNYYGPDWAEVRASIVERDGNACQDEGHKKGGGSHPDDRLVVHHRKPLKDFGGDYRAANDETNLITLCTMCHGRWHAELNRQAKAAAQ